MYSLRQNDDLPNIKLPDFTAHGTSGDQQQLYACLFPIGDQVLYCCKYLYLKRDILFLIEIVHEIQGIIYLQIADCEYIFLQFSLINTSRI